MTVEIKPYADEGAGLTYDALYINDEIIMSAHPMHLGWISTWARTASGKVLVCGLGMDLVEKALRSNPNVTQIDVVEINQEVIDYVHSVADRIILADALTYTPDQHYDYCYIDIWPYFCQSTWDAYLTQKQRYLAYADNIYSLLEDYKANNFPLVPI